MQSLLYFVKYPEPGKVKTRLAKTVGFEEAARRYRDLAEMNLKNLNSLTSQHVSIIITFDPPESESRMRSWLSDRYSYLPQSGPELGSRLRNAFQEMFQKGARKVLAIGSDTLGLEAKVVEEAFRELDSHDVVLGPAKDGGYYLIGLSRYEPELFQGIPWSSSSVLSTTLFIIQKKRLIFHLLKEMEDLDE